MKAAWLLLIAVSGGAHGADSLPQTRAAAWLQRMADAARLTAYEGVFVVQHGEAMHTLSITNHPGGPLKESRLTAMDGLQREVRCANGKSITVMADGTHIKMEKRLNGRHFPDLLPADAGPLANWYAVKVGKPGRVAGLDCNQVELIPKDSFRWGYVLCAEKNTTLPLKAVMINAAGQPLMQYTFAEIKLGAAAHTESPSMPDMPEPAKQAKPALSGRIEVGALPPGFSRIAAVRRQLPNKSEEVEHWVFSDGLAYISLFLEPAIKPVETLKGQSKKGMVNMVTRQVGNMQAIVLGDAPWPAVEAIAMSLYARK